jgi:hypothetical protein
VWAVIGAVLVVVGAVFAAGYAVGSNPAKPAAAPTAHASAQTAGVQGGTLDTNLASTLLPPPHGVRARRPKPSEAGGVLSLDDYLALLYPTTSATERGLLTGRGFVMAATVWFTTADGKQIADYLIEFATSRGAQSYALELASTHRDAYSGDQSFVVGGLTDGVGFEDAALDTYGHTRTNIYGAVGNVTLLFDFFVPAALDRAAALSYVNSQVARLASAEATAS